MVQLPKEHVTPKLESLPKDLRLEAEAIIAKKFNIKDPIKKTFEAFTDMVMPQMRDMFIDPRQKDSTLYRGTVNMARTVKGVLYNSFPDMNGGHHIDARCQCGETICMNIQSSLLIYNWMCTKCGNMAFVKIPPIPGRGIPGIDFPDPILQSSPYGRGMVDPNWVGIDTASSNLLPGIGRSIY